MKKLLYIFLSLTLYQSLCANALYKCYIEKPSQSGIYEIEIDPPATSLMLDNLSDLRITDLDNQFVPYFIYEYGDKSSPILNRLPKPKILIGKLDADANYDLYIVRFPFRLLIDRLELFFEPSSQYTYPTAKLELHDNLSPDKYTTSLVELDPEGTNILAFEGVFCDEIFIFIENQFGKREIKAVEAYQRKRSVIAELKAEKEYLLVIGREFSSKLKVPLTEEFYSKIGSSLPMLKHSKPQEYQLKDTPEIDKEQKVEIDNRLLAVMLTALIILLFVLIRKMLKNFKKNSKRV